jgi:hypothetical protein
MQNGKQKRKLCFSKLPLSDSSSDQIHFRFPHKFGYARLSHLFLDAGTCRSSPFFPHLFSSHIHDDLETGAKQFNSGRCQQTASYAALLYDRLKASGWTLPGAELDCR